MTYTMEQIHTALADFNAVNREHDQDLAAYFDGVLGLDTAQLVRVAGGVADSLAYRFLLHHVPEFNQGQLQELSSLLTAAWLQGLAIGERMAQRRSHDHDPS